MGLSGSSSTLFYVPWSAAWMADAPIPPAARNPSFLQQLCISLGLGPSCTQLPLPMLHPLHWEHPQPITGQGRGAEPHSHNLGNSEHPSQMQISLENQWQSPCRSACPSAHLPLHFPTSQGQFLFCTPLTIWVCFQGTQCKHMDKG